MKIKSLHETEVKIPRPGGQSIKVKPGEVIDVDDELGKNVLTSKGWMEVKEVKIKKKTTKKVGVK